MFQGGRLLFNSNVLAMDPACCCGSCGDCPYGTSQGGYPVSNPVVDTLYARITSEVGCSCLDGLCVTLNWSGNFGHQDGVWYGTVATPSCLGLPESFQYITLFLRCCAGTWWLGTDDCGGGATPGVGDPCPPQPGSPVNAAIEAVAGWTCRPFNITFNSLPSLTCCGAMPATISVNVTETPC